MLFPTDIIFVLECSTTILKSYYYLATSFVSDLVDRLPIDSGLARVGLVKYR